MYVSAWENVPGTAQRESTYLPPGLWNQAMGGPNGSSLQGIREAKNYTKNFESKSSPIFSCRHMTICTHEEQASGMIFQKPLPIVFFYFLQDSWMSEALTQHQQGQRRRHESETSQLGRGSSRLPGWWRPLSSCPETSLVRPEGQRQSVGGCGTTGERDREKGASRFGREREGRDFSFA